MDETDPRFIAAMASAVRILAPRDHTRTELARKLRRRKYSKEVVDAVVTECLRRNYVDDRRTARLLKESLERRGYGPLKIRQELTHRGIPDRQIRELVPEDPEAESVAARNLLSVRMGQFVREPDPWKRKGKIYRFLISRGFSPEVAGDLIQDLDD